MTEEPKTIRTVLEPHDLQTLDWIWLSNLLNSQVFQRNVWSLKQKLSWRRAMTSKSPANLHPNGGNRKSIKFQTSTRVKWWGGSFTCTNGCFKTTVNWNRSEFREEWRGIKTFKTKQNFKILNMLFFIRKDLIFERNSSSTCKFKWLPV